MDITFTLDVTHVAADPLDGLETVVLAVVTMFRIAYDT